MFDLLGIGHITLDHVYLVPHFPAADTKMTAVAGTDACGGPVPNALGAASRLGLHCGLIARVGDDLTAGMLLQDLDARGVSVEYVERVEGHSTPQAVILVEEKTGQRSVVLNRAGLPGQGVDRLSRGLPPCRMLLVDGKEEASLQGARLAKAAGIPVVADLGGQRDTPEELIACVDVLAVSKGFVLQHYPDLDLFGVTQHLHALGPRLVVVTLGSGGAVYCDGRESTWFPAWHPPRVIDTTGAGDVYHGALCHALLAGVETREALARAAVAGALACTQTGGVEGAPDLAQLMREVEAWDH